MFASHLQIRLMNQKVLEKSTKEQTFLEKTNECCLSYSILHSSLVVYNTLSKQEAHGPHRSPEKTVQINKHIWLYHNVDHNVNRIND